MASFNRVFHDKQIGQMWQKYNAIVKNDHNLNFKGKVYFSYFQYLLECMYFIK